MPLLWAAMPFLAGPALADALAPRERVVQIVASTMSWAIWAAVLAASLVPRATSLTVVRIWVPASLPLCAWAATAGTTGPLGAVDVAAIAAAAASTLVVLSAPVGDLFVNGSSYGDERRFALRPPAALLLGPIEVAWVAVVAGTTAGPLLLAAQSWVAGALAVVAGFPAAAAATRSLHQLSRRWVVFVPAGFVLHDLLTMTDALLIPRRMVARLGPAPAGTEATDLTAGAYGRSLQVDLAEPTDIARARPGPRRGAAIESVTVTALVFTPTRPDAVLEEARTRRVATTT